MWFEIRGLEYFDMINAHYAQLTAHNVHAFVYVAKPVEALRQRA